jgi:hypothetical protein
MTSSREQHDSTLQSAIQVARENESRWLEMQAKFSSDSDAMEQWASTVKLRRLEVERLETALAEAEKELALRFNTCSHGKCMLRGLRWLAMKMTLDPLLAAETKAMVALAFRNGPIEALHAGKQCPACAGSQGTSHISDEEMKTIMKSAVDKLYRLLWQRENDSKAYLENLALGERYTLRWDEPELKEPRRKGLPTESQNP